MTTTDLSIAARRTRSRALWPRVLLGALTMVGCGGENLYVGSDLLWSSQYESGDLSEWTIAGSSAQTSSAVATIAVATNPVHAGRYSAELGVTTATAGVQQGSSFGRGDGLPVEAYYSAWYFLPSRVSVGTFWVLMKFRMRRVVDDSTTSAELYDLNLRTLSSGDMSLRLYSHRTGGDIPLDVTDPVVPVGRWFQIEAFYRSAPDVTGRVTYWLDGQQILDIAGKPSGLTSWVGWDVCSIGEDLTPTHADIFVDDVAVSRTRVGPDGILVP